MRPQSAERRSGTPASHFIDPLVLARIDNLSLVARTVVQGFINGLHRSPFLGLSVDFAEHRPYMPGDDIRQIDWRLYARTDRFYIKQFEVETNTDFMLVLDISRSMDYGSQGLTKFDYSRFLVASLAWFSHGQRDRVGLTLYGEELVEYVPCAAKNFEDALYALERAQPSPAPAALLLRSLRGVAELIKRRGITVVVSDFYEDPQQVLNAVSELRHRGSEVIVFHVLDPAERAFPFEDATLFEDLETGRSIPVVPGKVRKQYTERLQHHVDTLRMGMSERGIDYTLLDTSEPLDYALFRYLSERERLRRVR